jgi:HEPN domain-containing protein
MSPRSSHDLALVLIARAQDDAVAARQLAEVGAVSDAIVGFHAQQAAEKALKAVLSEREVKYPFTHDLEHLARLVGESGDPLPTERDPISLTPWAAELRYEAPEELPPLDRRVAVDLAEAVLAWARAQLSAS